MGTLDVTEAQARMLRASIRNPRTRTDQPKPRPVRLSMRFKAMGKMTPAREEPLDAIPIASGRFRKKYWLTAVKVGVYVKPLLMPPKTPWTRINW